MKSDVQTLPGPHDITRYELPNGIVLLVRENHHVPSAVVTGSLAAGSLYEPSEANGLASFTASLLLRGTQTHNFESIHEMLEGNGASLNISGGRHTLGFSGKSLAEDLPMIVDLLADALRRPIFPEVYVERLRGQLVTTLKAREQYTRYVAARTFRGLVYPEFHPYHYPTSGEVETVSQITREQIIDFHRMTYGPRRMMVVIVGAVAAERAVELVTQALGDWENPQQLDAPSVPDVDPLREPRRDVRVMRDKSQSDVVLGTVGPSRFADDWQATNLANNIFGVFGMYGRIGDVVREEQGMAYYSYSQLDGGLGPGAWRVTAGVDPANVVPAVNLIRSEMRRLVDELVSEDELADSKANFIGRLPLQLESNEGVAGALVTMERYGLGLDYLLRYADEVNAITREQVRAAAQHYLDPEAYALAVAGPESDGFSGV